MKIMRNIMLARILGIAALASVPGIVWFGWWHLVITLTLAAAAAAATPSAVRPPSERPIRSWLRAVERRLRPHSWRPPLH